MDRPADIVDCDIHPAVRSMADLEPWLEKKWIEHYKTYGALRQTHYVTGAPYHKSQPNASRRDAYPPEGGPQGSSPSFLSFGRLERRLRQMRFHMIDSGDVPDLQRTETQVLAYAPFLERLRDAGRERATAWLDEHAADVGRRGSLDLQRWFA